MSEEVDMAEDKNKVQESGSLTGGDLDTSSVLEGAEDWEPVETKLVVWSLVIAGIALILGMVIVPTSIFH